MIVIRFIHPLIAVLLLSCASKKDSFYNVEYGILNCETRKYYEVIFSDSLYTNDLGDLYRPYSYSFNNEGSLSVEGRVSEYFMLKDSSLVSIDSSIKVFRVEDLPKLVELRECNNCNPLLPRGQALMDAYCK